MKIRYKLTDENMQTYGKTQWELNVPKETSGKGELCGSGWLHVYTSPELAAFLNPIHADFGNPRLFRVKCSGECKTDRGLKEGWTNVVLVEELPLPEVATVHRIAFAILCAKKVMLHANKDVGFWSSRRIAAWNKWAEDWLSGQDRTESYAAKVANDCLYGPLYPFWIASSAAKNVANIAIQRAAEAAIDIGCRYPQISLTSIAKKAMEVT